MKTLITIIVFLTVDTLGYCQPSALFMQKILQADTVILVSHESTIDGLGIEEELLPDTAIKTRNLRLVVDGYLNRNLIQQQKSLTIDERKQLLVALEPPEGIYHYTPATCFDPHHAIVLIKDRKISYVDFCFTCSNFSYSQDLNREMFVFVWKNIMAFFRNQGMTYMIPKS